MDDFSRVRVIAEEYYVSVLSHVSHAHSLEKKNDAKNVVKISCSSDQGYESFNNSLLNQTRRHESGNSILWSTPPRSSRLLQISKPSSVSKLSKPSSVPKPSSARIPRQPSVSKPSSILLPIGVPEVQSTPKPSSTSKAPGFSVGTQTDKDVDATGINFQQKILKAIKAVDHPTGSGEEGRLLRAMDYPKSGGNIELSRDQFLSQFLVSLHKAREIIQNSIDCTPNPSECAAMEKLQDIVTTCKNKTITWMVQNAQLNMKLGLQSLENLASEDVRQASNHPNLGDVIGVSNIVVPSLQHQDVITNQPSGTNTNHTSYSIKSSENQAEDGSTAHVSPDLTLLERDSNCDDQNTVAKDDDVTRGNTKQNRASKKTRRSSRVVVRKSLYVVNKKSGRNSIVPPKKNNFFESAKLRVFGLKKKTETQLDDKGSTKQPINKNTAQPNSTAVTPKSNLPNKGCLQQFQKLFSSKSKTETNISTPKERPQCPLPSTSSGVRTNTIRDNAFIKCISGRKSSVVGYNIKTGQISTQSKEATVPMSKRRYLENKIPNSTARNGHAKPNFGNKKSNEFIKVGLTPRSVPSKYSMSSNNSKTKSNSGQKTNEKKTESCESYDISDITYNNEDVTRLPKDPKKIPSWAIGQPLYDSLTKFDLHPIDVDELFGAVVAPDLNEMFKETKPRFNKRSSSAIWEIPLLPVPRTRPNEGGSGTANGNIDI